MSLAKSYCAELIGLTSEIITVEVDISNGLHSFSVVGLGDRSIEESKDRIAAAIKNTGFVSPKQKNQKVVISLAPADLRKEGPSFDLAMALAYLAAAGDIELETEHKLFIGELSLEGKVRRVAGLLPILCQATAQGFTQVYIPKENQEEASLAQGLTIFPVSSLGETIDHLMGRAGVIPLTPRLPSAMPKKGVYIMDMRAIRGNKSSKRGLEIAAAGAHNILMYGPPGTGKTMLAQSFSSILPPLSYEQSIEVTSVHSAAHILGDFMVTEPPFRSPHHTASYPSIVGGGNIPKPGEISLAHRGVLFMDEFPEFDRAVIEALRQPLEDRHITISRARGTVTFPAQCILIASMNPCPCGKGRDQGCTCTTKALENYRRKMSGPIIDRLDIWLNIHKIEYEKLAAPTSDAEDSETVRARVIAARDTQQKRFTEHGIRKQYNSEMDASDIEKCIMLSDDARSLLTASAKNLGLSGRGFHRVIKVARTIADLGGNLSIEKEHVLETLQYRQKIN